MEDIASLTPREWRDQIISARRDMVVEGWEAGERNIARLARHAHVTRDTIYRDLKSRGIDAVGRHYVGEGTLKSDLPTIVKRREIEELKRRIEDLEARTPVWNIQTVPPGNSWNLARAADWVQQPQHFTITFPGQNVPVYSDDVSPWPQPLLERLKPAFPAAPQAIEE